MISYEFGVRLLQNYGYQVIIGRSVSRVAVGNIAYQKWSEWLNLCYSYTIHFLVASIFNRHTPLLACSISRCYS